ncbi:MAG: pyridoxamine 5'-phosphate oxidase family protein [Firmicutes bacterium]|nr:pyridoxamine 5'-phosphate oxidase family protein [Bacillota bacterium]
MTREMYKKERQLSLEATKRIFASGHHGILSVNGDDGYPYAVPVNYVYLDSFIYIHSAKYGYKIDALKENDKVCFSAIIESEILPSKFTASFKSVVAFGNAEFVQDDEEKRKVLETFIDRFSPDFREGGLKFINAVFAKTEIIKINVTEMTGKSSEGGE